MKISALSAVFAAALYFSGCTSSELLLSAAEGGFRRDLKAAGEVISFRKIKIEEKEASGARIAAVHFESDIKWLTLEEALSSGGAARDAREYLDKLQSASSKFGGDRKPGTTESVKGIVILAKTDSGWVYKRLTTE